MKATAASLIVIACLLVFTWMVIIYLFNEIA